MSRYDIWVIAAIWIAVVFAFGSFADDPDQEITAALLGTFAGGLMTAVYLFVRETRTKKKTGRLLFSTSESGADHKARAGVVDVVVVLVLWIAGGIAAKALFSDATADWVSIALPLAYLLFLLVRRTRRPRSERPQDAGG
jgi:peptidoglycan/LPS O-acetylase OafA/YrhL